MPRTKSRSVKELYNGHRDRAKKRGIPFELTIKEWVGIWSLVLGPSWVGRRGRGKYKYCMARYKDTGPYAIWNVKIIKNAENASEMEWSEKRREAHSRLMKAKMADPETRRRCSVAKKGKPGNKLTEAQKVERSVRMTGVSNPKGSLAKMGKKNPLFGARWFHKDRQNGLFHPGQEPRGWRLGRCLGKKWFNDGVQTKSLFSDQVPVGWASGRAPLQQQQGTQL